MYRLSVLFGLALAACNPGTEEVPASSATTVKLAWTPGQVFHVAASYRIGAEKTEEIPTSLVEDEAPVFGEHWSDEVIWTYQVVETGLVPTPDDELYPYAETHDGVASLAVVRVWLEDELNAGTDALQTDPVVYLVFREDRDRLAAIVSFAWENGERVQRAVSSKALGRSWSALSQSMLTEVPTYLAPFSARYEDDSRVLENGSLLDTVMASDGVVDTFYDDELGGGLIASRYEVGQPWPSWTVSDNLESHLMDEDDVRALRGGSPWPAAEPPESFDYRAALRATIDIEAALTLDEATMNGGWRGEVYPEYRPWAGSWWPLKHAGLVFGYDGRDTLSDRVKDQVDPIVEATDRLSEAIRGMATDDPARAAKVQEYQDKQGQLVDVLVQFYSGVLADLDGGRLTVSGDKLQHIDGWSYDLDELSPFDKMALHEYLAGYTSPNPFYLPAWEILNQYNPVGGSWWGHCNGWSAAAILTDEPRAPITRTVAGHDLTFTTADLKGLLTEAHYSVNSSFYGERYRDAQSDITDLHPDAFHALIGFYLRDQGVPMVFDTTADDAVWNYPAWAAEVLVEETSPTGRPSLINVNTADAATLDTLPGIGQSLAAAIIRYRETWGPFQATEDLQNVSGIGSSTYEDLAELVTVSPVERTFAVVADITFSTDAVDETHVDGSVPEGFSETWGYTLVTDADGLVLRGTWDADDEHPDFAWIPYYNAKERSNGGSENPYLVYGRVLEVTGASIERD